MTFNIAVLIVVLAVIAGIVGIYLGRKELADIFRK